MAISWDEFDGMMSSLDEDVERLQELAERQDPADGAEYDTVWQRALDTANKIRESRGVYLQHLLAKPPAEMAAKQGVANSAISWLLQNKGALRQKQ